MQFYVAEIAMLISSNRFSSFVYISASHSAENTQAYWHYVSIHYSPLWSLEITKSPRSLSHPQNTNFLNEIRCLLELLLRELMG